MNTTETVAVKKTNRWLIFLVSFAFGLIIAGATGGAMAMRTYGSSSLRTIEVVTEPADEPTPDVPAAPAQGMVTISALVLPPPPPPPEAISAFSTPYGVASSAETHTAQLLGL